MTFFAGLVFTYPWFLLLLLGLPALWYVLKAVPPAPKRFVFSGMAFLQNIPKQEKPAKATWWLLLLRLLIIFLLITALAQPLWKADVSGQSAADKPLIIVLDTSWAAAANWPEMLASVETVLQRQVQAEQWAAVLTTARNTEGEFIQQQGILPMIRWQGWLQQQQPQPWPQEIQAVLQQGETLPQWQEAAIYFISSGVISSADVEKLNAQNIQAILHPPLQQTPQLALGAVQGKQQQMQINLYRWDGIGSAIPEQDISLQMVNSQGQVLQEEAVTLPQGKRSFTAEISIPREILRQLEQIRLLPSGEKSVRTLANRTAPDSRAAMLPLGIVTSGQESGATLLRETYYLEKAAETFAGVRKGTIADLMQEGLPILLLPDATILTAAERDNLSTWIEQGGILVRFAGDVLEGRRDALLPVDLRFGKRSYGGSLTWDKAPHLAGFPEHSPFQGIVLPEERPITVKAHILPEPTANLAEKTWALLSDGTPLVTAQKKEQGLLVLFHTTATPVWSELVLSEVFLQMIERIVLMGSGWQGQSAATLPLLRYWDAFGRWQQPYGAVKALEWQGGSVYPKVHWQQPAGLYGQNGLQRLLPLGESLRDMQLLELTATAPLSPLYEKTAPEIKIWPLLLAFAALLFVIEQVASLWLRGILRLPRQISIALYGLVFSALLASSAQAEQAQQDVLAYITTGIQEVDSISRNGLMTLTRVLYQRTSVELAPPVAVSLETDDLTQYPILYWPLLLEVPLPEPALLQKINAYLQADGLLFIDTQSASTPLQAKAAEEKIVSLLQALGLPAVTTVDRQHLLARTFYVLEDFPGRYKHGDVWSVKPPQGEDIVSAVVIGSNAYAPAWATTPEGDALLPAVPGGSMQREISLRFGVNLVIYAFTGTYKDDQVHLDNLLQRIGN